LVIIVKQRRRIRIFDSLVPFILFLLTQFDCFLQVPVLCSHPLLRQRLLTFLYRPSQIIVILVSLGPIQLSPSGILVIRLTIIIRRSRAANHTITHMGPGTTFMAETSFILQEIGYILCLLPDIGTLILSFLVNVLKFFQRLDDVNVIAEINDNVFRALVEAIVQNRKTLYQASVGKEVWESVRTLKT